MMHSYHFRWAAIFSRIIDIYTLKRDEWVLFSPYEYSLSYCYSTACWPPDDERYVKQADAPISSISRRYFDMMTLYIGIIRDEAYEMYTDDDEFFDTLCMHSRHRRWDCRRLSSRYFIFVKPRIFAPRLIVFDDRRYWPRCIPRILDTPQACRKGSLLMPGTPRYLMGWLVIL